MKMRILIAMLLSVYFSSMGLACAQTLDISFMQGEKISLHKTNGNHYEITIKPKPFAIIFNGAELNVCVGFDEALFQAVKTKTDINKDYKSPFFIYKYTALPKNGDHLHLYNTGANSLNKSHGAKKFNGNYQYTVSSIMASKKLVPISNLKQLFLALWLDQNKDQYIDENELIRVKVKIKA